MNRVARFRSVGPEFFEIFAKHGRTAEKKDTSGGFDNAQRQP
jgi:hypothetical protein